MALQEFQLIDYKTIANFFYISKQIHLICESHSKNQIMKILKFLAVLLLLLAATVVSVGLINKGPFNVSRSIEIKASKAAVWNLINNLKSIESWSPWTKIDPKTEKTYTGEDGKVGSKYAWKSNHKDVGEGDQTINFASEDSIGMDLNLITWKAKNKVGLKMAGEDGKVKVTWNMMGENGFISAIFSTIFRMENMLKEQFDQGLNTLKEMAEKGGATAQTEYKVEEIDFPSTTIAATETKNKELKTLDSNFYKSQFGLVAPYIGKNKLNSQFKTYGVFKNYKSTASGQPLSADVWIGMDVDKEAPAEGTIKCTKIGGKALKVTYYGTYDGTMGVYASIQKYADSKKLNQDYSVEHYVTDPSKVNYDWSKVQTDIYMILK